MYSQSSVPFDAVHEHVAADAVTEMVLSEFGPRTIPPLVTENRTGVTVSVHDGRSKKSALGIAGTVTFCSPGPYPSADARIRNVSGFSSDNAYPPVPSVVANLPVLLPFKTSTREPTIGRCVS